MAISVLLTSGDCQCLIFRECILFIFIFILYLFYLFIYLYYFVSFLFSVRLRRHNGGERRGIEICEILFPPSVCFILFDYFLLLSFCYFCYFSFCFLLIYLIVVKE